MADEYKLDVLEAIFGTKIIDIGFLKEQMKTNSSDLLSELELYRIFDEDETRVIGAIEDIYDKLSEEIIKKMSEYYFNMPIDMAIATKEQSVIKSLFLNAAERLGFDAGLQEKIDSKLEEKADKLNKRFTFDEASLIHLIEASKGSNIQLEEDIQRRESNGIILNKDIDFNVIIETIPKGQISDKCFNDDTKELIKQLSFVYNLDTLDMQGLVRNSINEKGMIDKALLRKSCRDYYKFDNYGNLPTLIYNRQPEFLKKPKGDNSKWAKMIYTFENITPYQLLKAKYNGAEPTDRDKKLVESLLIDQKLNPGVINVLVSYVLKTNNQQLTKSYVETIAGQWKRLGIETVEEAMKLTEKEYKKSHKKKDNKEPSKKNAHSNDIPAWFNQENKIVEATDEDVEELDNILKELV